MKRILALVVVGLLWAVGASAQVTFDANSGAVCQSGTGVTSKSCAALLTVGSSSNRALVCQVAWDGAVTGPALTWDSGATNQAMTAITGATATNTVQVMLFGLVAPTSGAKTLAASWTNARQVDINCVSWTGVNQTGGATSFPHGTSATANTGTNTGAVTVTSAVNNAVMGVFATNDAGMASVDNTSTFLDNTPSLMSVAGNRAAGAATVTLTGTRDATSHVASAGTDIAASTGGAACAPTLTLLGVGRCG